MRRIGTTARPGDYRRAVTLRRVVLECLLGLAIGLACAVVASEISDRIEEERHGRR